MGAWGEGPFDNDDASDWAYHFDEADGVSGLEALSRALDVGAPQDYLESSEGAIAVAAATVVSWLQEPSVIPESPYGATVAAWVRSVGSLPAPRC